MGIRMCMVAVYAAVAGIAPLQGIVAEDSAACEERITLPELRAKVLGSSPMTAAIDKRYAYELASAIEKEVLLNPELQAERTFTRMNLGGDDDPQAQVSLSMPLRLSDFGSRARVAELLRKAAEAQKGLELLELLTRVKVAYLNLHSLQQLEKVVMESSALVDEQVKLVEDGVKKGLFSKGEEDLFHGESGRLHAQILDIRSEISAAQEKLAQEALLKCTLVAEGGETSLELPSIEVLTQKADESPIGLKSRLELARKLSVARRSLAEDDQFPTIAPRLLYQHTNDGGDFFGIGVTMPLPFFNRNQGELTRALADEQLALSERNAWSDSEAGDGEKTNGTGKHRLTLMRSVAASKLSGAALYQSKVVPSFESALKAQIQMYKSGRGNVMQVWQMLRELTSVKGEAVQRAVAAEIARAQLSIMVGEEL